MSRIRSSLIALLLCLHGQLFADTGFRLEPAAAQYRVRIAGVPTGMEARIALLEPASGQFQLDFTVQHPLIRHHESSQFIWQNNCQAQPMGYSYQSSGFGIKRGGAVEFDWLASLAHGNTDSFPIDLGAVDALGLAMMARCDLHRGKHTLVYQVAEPEGITEFRYHIIGPELLRTPAGDFNTIKIERIYPQADKRTYMWAAKELNYFMVRMDHIENAVLRGKMEMVSFTPQAAETAAMHSVSTGFTP